MIEKYRFNRDRIKFFSSNMNLTLIAAFTLNRVIGNEGKMPWHLPDELSHFRKTTLGHHVMIGRRTYEGISRGLKGRKLLVLSRKRNFIAPGARVVDSVQRGIAIARDNGEKELFIAGGEQVFRQVMNRVDCMILTEIECELPGDTYFPDIQWKSWKTIRKKFHPVDLNHQYAFTITHYVRR